MARPARRSGHRQGGSILLFSLLVAFTLATLINTHFIRSTAALTGSERTVHLGQAFHLAEAGVERAISVLSASSLSWDDELLGADNVAGTSDDGILSFGPSVSLSSGSYAVGVFDNADETSPPDDPATDVDGVLRIVATGTAQGTQRQLEAHLWARFNHAVAANVDIILEEGSAVGNIHANRNIVVNQTSTMVGSSQATATGAFIFAPGETLVQAGGDLIGGDPPITFLQPDEAAIASSVNNPNPPNWNGVILLSNQDIAGYTLGHDVTPDTIALAGSATVVVFGGYNITFAETLGVHNGTSCTSSLQVSIIALGGGGITFGEKSCIRGLIWAEGPITIGERSSIAGAVVSNNSTVTVKEKSQITFDRDVISNALLTGFTGATRLSWRDLP